ncbi:hypothetical protein M3231_18540 [Neobacillus mesonae]|nr:hypothetical protein [Neobacillus mesonae]
MDYVLQQTSKSTAIREVKFILNLSMIPVPYIVVDAELHILSSSEQTSQVFSKAENFKEWLDEGSITKAEQYISKIHSRTRIELIMNTKANPFAVFDIYQQWDDQGLGHLICIEQIQKIQTVTDKLQLLHEDLQRPLHIIHETGERAAAGHSKQSASHRELRSALETIRELVDMLYPSLIEIDQTIYADIIKNQIDSALSEPAEDNVHQIPTKFNEDHSKNES